MAPDAFTNPDYVRYALKTTLAIFIAYVTYNMLNWPGIRTCMITCFFVSLGTFGETVQKMALRMVGALIGGGLGMATIIFLMPHLTTITGLILVTAPVAFFAAWVATSSERLSYAGLQIALAFFLSILVGYGPTTNITEARDRVVGVLLGNLIIFLVYTFIWPTTVVDQARLSLAAAVSKLSQMLASGEKDALFLAFIDAIAQAKRFVSFMAFEGQSEKNDLQQAAEALCGPVILLRDPLLSDWLAQVAEQIKSGEVPRVPFPREDSDWARTLEERIHKLETLLSAKPLVLKEAT